jgi:hypothetical protein
MLDISQTVFGDVTEDVAHSGKNLQHYILPVPPNSTLHISVKPRILPLREGTTMEPTQAIAALTSAFGLIEKARTLYKDLMGRLPDNAAKAEATKDLQQADEAMQLARVELAKALGYPLCQRHFPPGIKIDVREDQFPRWKCSDCGDVSPRKSNQPPLVRGGGFVNNY